MKRIYLDNAATTMMHPDVVKVMTDCMLANYGNPSSTHSFGRNAKAIIENSRKKIAHILKVKTNELVFTSGGTEADNLILKNAVSHLGVQHIITSPVEHHAVLKTVMSLKNTHLKVSLVNILDNGGIDYEHLETLLNKHSNTKTLISLMYVNNEIGTILDIQKVVDLKQQYQALFHTDAVQAVGHFDLDLQSLGVDFLVASGHKFHGPKGVGFAYFKNGTGILPEILGGEQERGTRAGTENTAAIQGMEKALSLCTENLTSHVKHLKAIKQYFIEQIEIHIPSVVFNGDSNNLATHSFVIANIRLPKNLPMLLFQLDLKGIAVSGGSACQSGAHKGSHVLQAFLDDNAQQLTSLRVSFSKFTTLADVGVFVSTLKEII